MTDDEAIKVLHVVSTADGGCPYCARDLLYGLRRTLPLVDWVTLAENADGTDLPDIGRRCREMIAEAGE